MPVGAACDPRLKSQRSWGREREAGCERRRGMEKAERAAMPPEVRRAVVRVRIWMGFDMVGWVDGCDCCWL
jgi:hypothetical protein